MDSHQETPVRAMLEVDLASDPICGSVVTVGGSSRAFVGWLGLTVALESLRAHSAMNPGSAKQ